MIRIVLSLTVTRRWSRPAVGQSPVEPPSLHPVPLAGKCCSLLGDSLLLAHIPCSRLVQAPYPYLPYEDATKNHKQLGLKPHQNEVMCKLLF